MQIQSNDPKLHVFRFDGINEAVDKIDPWQISNMYQTQKASWVGASIPSKGAFIDKINSVWDQGLKTINSFVEQLKKLPMPEAKSKVRKLRYHEDDGDELDLDRLRSGQSYWRKTERELTSGTSEITIMFDSGGHWKLDNDYFLWRGAAAIALTEILESLGYRVELWMVYKTLVNENDHQLLHGVQVKRTSDPLDRSSLSMVVSSWFHRQGNLNLGSTEGQELFGIKEMHGAGRQGIPTQNDLDYYSTDERRLYVAGVESFHQAASLVRHELEKLSEQTV